MQELNGDVVSHVHAEGERRESGSVDLQGMLFGNCAIT
jgi:hypothetical protein